MKNKDKKIGLVGQGFIGKNYADDFEKRGFNVIRYSLEEPHINNKEKIKECHVVFIAVNANTTPAGFDDSNIREALELVGEGNIVVIKSTLIPGMTKELQKDYKTITILFSPEFLSEATAAHDARNPFSNIIGIPIDDKSHRNAAESIHEVLPKALFSITCDSDEAEIVKYSHNVAGFMQVITFNLMYDMATSMGLQWDTIKKALTADPFVNNHYINPVHKSGRGAGGHCFIKDFAAFSQIYKKVVGDELGVRALKSLEDKNVDLLVKSGKDLNLLNGVYGKIEKN